MSPKCVSAGAAALALAGSAQAANLVQNGDFELTTLGTGQIGYNTAVSDWSVPAGADASYAFLFGAGAADTTGAIDQFSATAPLKLWGPNDGSANSLPATSPAGGDFVAMDGAFNTGALSQTIAGLTPGQKYQVGFWYGYAQQAGFTGADQEQWKVSFGSQTQDTSLYNLPSEGFSGWKQQTFTFTADGASDILSFLAGGSGAPPFALLDGVTLTPVTGVTSVPEPTAWALLMLGLFGVGAAARRRRAAAFAA